MLTYTALEGKVYDLTDLTGEERAHFDAALIAYRAGMDWAEFGTLFVFGASAPHLRATGGVVTPEIYRTPFFRALRDLAHRLAIAQHAERPSPADDVERDPVADEWLPAAEAAGLKGVALSGLHAAIQRGDVLARPTRPGGKWLLVSRRSLDRWTPNLARQSAGRARKRAAAG